MSQVLSTITAAAALAPERPRLGQISFINSLPVVFPIEQGQVELAANVVYGTPSMLNDAYVQGSLDIGAMSSFCYLSEGCFELVPNLSISSEGAVGSVLFFSKVSPDKLGGVRIAVPAASATSVNLLKILLLEQLGLMPEFVVEEAPNLEDPLVSGALVIGDLALEVDGVWSNKYWRADLGQWWLSQTGLPMVFGLWAARSNWVKANYESFSLISQQLLASKQMGLTTLLPMIITAACARGKLSAQRVKRYFQQQLCFELGTRHFEGLELFRRLCSKYGLLK
ncbi:MAG: menaquinone biosynthesis protein [Candidatus Melainabacteria bacterium]|nr:menaquinone biosynthesis protein [Candidatus Melainabacteria bacterium]